MRKVANEKIFNKKKIINQFEYGKQFKNNVKKVYKLRIQTHIPPKDNKIYYASQVK